QNDKSLTRLAPSYSNPEHYGTYWPIGLDGVRPHEFHAPGDEFVRQAAKRAPGVRVHLLGHGERVAPVAGR
ncbi:MBL fold metallo-hydrolase, partial [Streptomyces sp. NPDC059346]